MRLWCEHWVYPLCKRFAVNDTDNYRGIQLTAQLSKVVERILAQLFVPRLDRLGAYGSNQFAYCRGRGARDAALHFILRWLVAFAGGRRVVIYCSDVSGAFDRVDKSRLMHKIRSLSVQPDLVVVLDSWLAPRSSRIVVQGSLSEPAQMENMVHQGTVIGSILRNVYYSDSCMAARASEFEEVIFADDLKAFKILDSSVSDQQAFSLARECRTSLHRWGAANRVLFDPGKESFHILSRSRPAGSCFKVLGINLDTRLLMHDGISDCVRERGWRIHNILRNRRFYTDSEIILFYKSHVLSYIEYRTAAFHFASSSALAPLDAAQSRLLRAVHISDFDALMYFWLAPLGTRRDMSMLGIIHRSVLGKRPPLPHQFFRLDSTAPPHSRSSPSFLSYR